MNKEKEVHTNDEVKTDQPADIRELDLEELCLIYGGANRPRKAQ